MTVFEKAYLYGLTVRNLQLRQVFYLLKDRLLPQFKPGTADAGLLRDVSFPLRFASEKTGPFVKAHNSGADVDVFGEKFEWREGCSWNLKSGNKLKVENLFYLEFLYHLLRSNEPDGKVLAVRIGLDLLERRGSFADSAYTTARRLSVLLLLAQLAQRAGERRRFAGVAAEHAKHIMKKIEYHLDANHLLKCGRGLLIAGLFLRHLDASLWRQRGMQIISNALKRQVLPDGGHYERAFAYHCLIMEDLMDAESSLPRMGRFNQLRRALRRRIIEMAQFLARCLHPDGCMPLFGDTARGLSLEPSLLLGEVNWRFGCSISTPSEDILDFQSSGFYGARFDDGTFVIVSAGPMGAPGQPGHAHCDMLSFELSLGGERVVVDTGVYDYSPGERRDYCRSTAAHNVIQVDGSEQARFWAAHRFATLAKPRTIRKSMLLEGSRFWELSVAARPFHGSDAIWTRNFFCAPGVLKVTDNLSPRSPFESFLHLNPSCESAGSGLFRIGNVCVKISSPTSPEIRRTPVWESFFVEDTRKTTLVQTSPSNSSSYKIERL